MEIRRLWIRSVALLLMLLTLSSGGAAYSVLTHEEIVDLLWLDEIKPLILQRYPDLTDDQIKEAHAYAYGGSVIQDLGYYPFGSHEFSDLVHYVRTGDFVRELIAESNDANEYGFALGALSHYASDKCGHPLAVNLAVPIEYPKLREKYGNSVRYAQDTSAHLKTEFGFDAEQVAKRRYAPEQFHDFIGFKVSKPLLERVFPIVYGLQLKDVLPREDLSIGTYRYSVSTLIPKMTQVALQTHKKEFVQEKPDFDKREFLYRLSRSDYEREWGTVYERPGLGTRILAVLLGWIPKVGPFKGLGFKTPTPQTEDLYIKSINTTVDDYRKLLEEVRNGKPMLSNSDLDTGNPTKPGEYSLTDETYAKLLGQLAKKKFDHTSPQLRDNIMQFYAQASPSSQPNDGKISSADVTAWLNQLKAMTPVANSEAVAER
jgi:zinc dependent phospholipase C